MAGYRRLISYIYAYEGEEKGKNIGFAKLEARNGQCRLSINVKKIYAGGNDMGVYLLSSGQEIFLGNIFIRNGSGDFRTCVNVENVMGTGCSMDSCIGLVIHEREEWSVYKTVWEDAVAQAAELEFAEVTSEKRGDLDELLKKHIEELNQEIDEAAKVGDKAEKGKCEKAVRHWNRKIQQASGAPQNTSEAAGITAVWRPAETQDVETRETIEAPIPSAPAPQPQTRSKLPSQTSSHSHPSLRPAHLGNTEGRNPWRSKSLEHLDAEEEKWGPEVLWDRFETLS